MELCSVLCGSLDGRGIWRRVDTCICTAESLRCYLKLSQHCYKIKVKKNKIKFESIKKTHLVNNFEVYKTVFFTIITVLYISSPELTYL